MIKNLPHVLIAKSYLEKLRSGDEQGLNYFYKQYYYTYYKRAAHFVKDSGIAADIAQEAFLRLWLLRKSLQDICQLQELLFRQIREAAGAYYRKSSTRFQRSLLQLDAIDNYQEFMLGYEAEREAEEDPVYFEALEAEKAQQLAQLQQLLPNLPEQQQLFIRLCLKYSFNYERIAWHLGGISDYEVAQQVEKSIAAIRASLCDGQKLAVAAKPKAFVCEGGLSEEQVEIMRLRYELQYSFEEIAEALKLKDKQVRRLFIQAYAVIKSNRKSA